VLREVEAFQQRPYSLIPLCIVQEWLEREFNKAMNANEWILITSIKEVRIQKEQIALQ
jgi:hypothetical protein